MTGEDIKQAIAAKSRGKRKPKMSAGERLLQAYHHHEQVLIDALEWLDELEDFDKIAEVVERTKERLDETFDKMREEANTAREEADAAKAA